MQTTALSNRRAEVWRGVVTASPVMLGFIPFALVLGAQAAQKGLSIVEVPLMTGLNFAGGSEFAAVGLWTSPPHMLLIMAVTFLVNSRHLLMSAVLTPFLQHLPKRKALICLYIMCDESWALGLNDCVKRQAQGLKPAFSLPFYLGAAFSLYLTWLIFTFIGALLGPVMGSVERYGFDMAFVAVFLVLLKGMWQGFKAARPWLVSFIVAAVTYYFIPGAWYVATGAVAGLVSAYFWAYAT